MIDLQSKFLFYLFFFSLMAILSALLTKSIALAFAFMLLLFVLRTKIRINLSRFAVVHPLSATQIRPHILPEILGWRDRKSSRYVKAVKIKLELDALFTAITQNQAISDQCQVIILSPLAKPERMMKAGFSARKPSYFRMLASMFGFYTYAALGFYSWLNIKRWQTEWFIDVGTLRRKKSLITP
jgi:hypothetical protein